MRKLLVFLISNIIAINSAFSQGAAINTTSAQADPSAMLDVSSNNQGMLIPRMTTANRPANPIESLLIYNTDSKCFEAYNALTSQWVSLWCLGVGFTCGSAFIDTRDNKFYNTVLIGTQCWFKENLNSTKYVNGDAIPNVTDNTAWNTLTTGAYCNYNNDLNNATIYGRLYNWYAVNDSRKLCPFGWHVPTDTDWQTLTDYLGGISIAGGKMKETGLIHWITPNSGATNSCGFSALPGGYRYDYVVTYDGIGYFSYWWSASENITTDAWYRLIGYSGEDVHRYNGFKKYGYSVRCLKD